MTARQLGLAVLLALATSCALPTEPDAPKSSSAPPVITTSNTEQAIVDGTNAERRNAGLAALAVNAKLMQAAEIQGEQVAAAGRLEHDLPAATYPTLQDRVAAAGYDWRAIGENLAFGQRDAAAAIDAWMNSSGHRANILNVTYTEIGVAFVTDVNGRPYYVQVFGRPR